MRKNYLGIMICIMFLLFCVHISEAGNGGSGYMGGKGTVVTEEDPPADTGDEGGLPEDVDGPLNDKMADSGKLFGDLYRILRQTGVADDVKLVPQVDENGEPVLTDGVQLFVKIKNTTDNPYSVVGGEPVLTVIDPGDENTFADYGWYAAEIGINDDETPIYGAARSPYPAQCVQPVANYERWGDISSKTGLSRNRLPLVITYDATWGRSECEVNLLTGEVVADPATGELTFPVNPYFIEKGGKWTDPVNGEVTYLDGMLWSDLIEEVGFGRLNISRSPEAVLQSAFDEAINNINSPDTIAIEIDASGRLLLTRNVYDDLQVNVSTGEPLVIDTVKKAIDSPLENVALYLKLMQDGHLVTPGDEREPIDRSKNGGIPIWKILELEDGPADAVLRPTIDIAKLRYWGLGSLVNVAEVNYYTYYKCVDADGEVTECLCEETDPVQPELESKWVACEDVVDRELFAVQACPEGVSCEGPFTGIMTDGDYVPDSADLISAVSHLAAAADKTGDIGVDMVVYLNSILGINKVLGTSEDGLIDYEKTPQYFNYLGLSGYDRMSTFKNRGQVCSVGGNGLPSSYDGNVAVLQNSASNPFTWEETSVEIMAAQMDKDGDEFNETIFDNIGQGENGFPDEQVAAENILGFAQQSDDNLSVIRFIHTFQIPGLR